VRLGAGAKPQPRPPRQPLIKSNSNINQTTYITRNNVWRAGRVAITKMLHACRGHGVESVDCIKFLYNQPIIGCHVAAHDWATWHCTTKQKTTTCRNVIHPNLPINECHITIHHLSVWMCHLIVHPLPRQLYGLYSQQFFLLV
jgi:hypothetical protein